MASNRPKRAALTLLPALTLVVFLSAFVVALAQTGAAGQASAVTVDVGALPVGSVKTVTLTIHALDGARWHVFIGADAPGHVLALVGRPQSASGCEMSWSHAPGYPSMEQRGFDGFEDPCGGAVFRFDGACIDGPCWHGLDRLTATRVANQVRVSIDTLIPGTPGKMPYWRGA
jgi:hypothetical protein